MSLHSPQLIAKATDDQLRKELSEVYGISKPANTGREKLIIALCEQIGIPAGDVSTEIVNNGGDALKLSDGSQNSKEPPTRKKLIGHIIYIPKGQTAEQQSDVWVEVGEFGALTIRREEHVSVPIAHFNALNIKDRVRDRGAKGEVLNTYREVPKYPIQVVMPLYEGQEALLKRGFNADQLNELQESLYANG